LKIISKFKDYYDFLTGIYGVDPLIVLDRLDFSMPIFRNFPPSKAFPDGDIEEGKLRLYIGGFYIEAYYNGDKIYYGEELKQFAIVEKHSSWYYRYHMNSTEKPKDKVSIKVKSSRYHCESFNLFIIKDTLKMNDKYNCPILSIKNDESDKNIHKNCILKDLNLNSFISPEEVYKMISDWISYQRTIAEEHVDTMTNVQKIESKGFDKKTSFRPNMK